MRSADDGPPAQVVQALAPAAEYSAGVQLEQAAALVWPGSAENVPAGQIEQAATLVCPGSPENVPAAQGVHGGYFQPIIFHSAMKPLYVIEISVVKVIRRNPVVDLYVLPWGSAKPECLRICVCGTHEAELHSKICTKSNPSSVLIALNEI